MSDALLLQQVYTGSEYIRMIEMTQDWHAAYCQAFDIDYQIHVCGDVHEPGGWEKLRLAQDLLDKYKLVVWLDADAFIEDTSVDLRSVPSPTDSLGAVWFQFWKPHWNVGVLYFRAGERVSRFLDEWLGRYPGEDERWHEQQVFQELAMLPGSPVFTLSAEWNCSLDHNWQEERIVSAFHGCPNRYETMRSWFEKARNVKMGARARFAKQIEVLYG